MPAVVASQGGGAVLDGVLERVTFANPETGYTIARIAPEHGGAELITAVGPLLGAQIGEFLRLRGRWSSHPEYGRQFKMHSYATVLPATAAGIQKYLGSGLIKGMGLHIANGCDDRQFGLVARIGARRIRVRDCRVVSVARGVHISHASGILYYARAGAIMMGNGRQGSSAPLEHG